MSRYRNVTNLCANAVGVDLYIVALVPWYSCFPLPTKPPCNLTTLQQYLTEGTIICFEETQILVLYRFLFYIVSRSVISCPQFILSFFSALKM